MHTGRQERRATARSGACGFPMKTRISTKLSFKNPKYVVAMEVTNTDKGGYWENKGYNWFRGLFRPLTLPIAAGRWEFSSRRSRGSR